MQSSTQNIDVAFLLRSLLLLLLDNRRFGLFSSLQLMLRSRFEGVMSGRRAMGLAKAATAWSLSLLSVKLNSFDTGSFVGVCRDKRGVINMSLLGRRGRICGGGVIESSFLFVVAPIP